MEGTRQYILNRILDWVANPQLAANQPKNLWALTDPLAGPSGTEWQLTQVRDHVTVVAFEAGTNV